MTFFGDNQETSLSEKMKFDIYNSESFKKGTKVISVKSFTELNKEFIKKLKKEISKIDDYNTRYSIPAFEIIDKLAGDFK